MQPIIDPVKNEIFNLAVKVLESNESATTWLNRPRKFFGWKSPLQMIAEGKAEEVKAILLGIEHGVFTA